MGKKKGNHLGSVRRMRLMSICRHLGFENVAGLSNKAVTEMILAARPQIPEIKNHHRLNAIGLLDWFAAHEPAALKKSAQPKRIFTGPTGSAKDLFYRSWEWRTLRMEALKEHGAVCQCCGARPGDMTTSGDPVRICVDHIKPISKYWSLRLDRRNLQILCDECNQGKGAWDETDWRDEPAKDDLIAQQLRYVI